MKRIDHEEPHWHAATGTWSWPGEVSSATHFSSCKQCARVDTPDPLAIAAFRRRIGIA